LHEHHLIIRVGAGLFVYGSHSRLAADLTLDKNPFLLPFSRAFSYQSKKVKKKTQGKMDLSTTSIQRVSLFINHLQGRRLDGVAMNETISNRWYMMMIAFIAFNSSLVPVIEGLCTSNPWEFEFSGFRRN